VNTKIMGELLNYTNYQRWAREMIILMAGKELSLIVQGLETYPAGSSMTLSTSTTGSSSITFTWSTSRTTEMVTKEQIKWKS